MAIIVCDYLAVLNVYCLSLQSDMEENLLGEDWLAGKKVRTNHSLSFSLFLSWYQITICLMSMVHCQGNGKYGNIQTIAVFNSRTFRYSRLVAGGSTTGGIIDVIQEEVQWTKKKCLDLPRLPSPHGNKASSGFGGGPPAPIPKARTHTHRHTPLKKCYIQFQTN